MVIKSPVTHNEGQDRSHHDIHIAHLSISHLIYNLFFLLTVAYSTLLGMYICGSLIIDTN